MYADDNNPQAPSPDVGRFGMMLFLAALGMLFGASIVGYIALRTQVLNPAQSPEPPLGSLSLPWGLWISTLIMLASSVALHNALRAVRNGNFRGSYRWMAGALVLAIAFLVVQAPCLWNLAAEHRAMAGGNVLGYAMAAVLIVVHAAHVIGGMIPMAVITVRTAQQRYTPDAHQAVRYMAMYWHFIDAIWLIMFAVFGVLR